MNSLILILFATFLLYLRSIPGKMEVFDDPAILDIEEVHKMFSTYGSAHYLYDFLGTFRPMTHWGYYWTWRAFGYSAPVWHVFNILLHLTNISLFYVLLKTLDFQPFTCVLAAIIFAVHPLQASGVAYISNRAAIQSATFAYAGLLGVALGNPLTFALAYVLARKSKEDAWIYMAFVPMVLYFSGQISPITLALYGVLAIGLTRITRLRAGSLVG